MEYKQIQELIKLIDKSELGELRIKNGDFELTLRSKEYIQAVKGKGGTQVVSMPSSPAATAPPPETGPAEKPPSPPAEEKAEESNLITVKSPMIGTFYRSPSPDKDSYVKVGDTVSKGDVLCIIEAMKLFNEIESEYDGKIVKVLLEDSSPVEYDQPIFLIDPNA